MAWDPSSAGLGLGLGLGLEPQCHHLVDLDCEPVADALHRDVLPLPRKRSEREELFRVRVRVGLGLGLGLAAEPREGARGVGGNITEQHVPPKQPRTTQHRTSGGARSFTYVWARCVREASGGVHLSDRFHLLPQEDVLLLAALVAVAAPRGSNR